jgi:hypothetical protein
MLNLNEVVLDQTNTSNDLQPIPDGTVVRAIINFTGGDEVIQEFSQLSIFKRSQTTSAIYCPMELNVIGGSHDKRRVWHNLFVHGDKMGNNGVPVAREIGLRTLRNMVDSAFNLNPDDQSPEAQGKRNITGVEDLQGQEICFVVAIEKGTNGYADRNKIKIVLTPKDNNFIGSGNAAVSVNGGAVNGTVNMNALPQNVANSMQAQMPVQQQNTGVTPQWAK